jgi:hypothetical protein
MLVTAGGVLALAFGLAACGGSSKSSSATTISTSTTSTNRSTSPSGNNYSLAGQILNSLGLKQCFRKNIPGRAFTNPGGSNAGVGSFAGGSIFTVAHDCSKGPKSLIIAATFSTHQGIAAGKATIKKKYPKAGVSSFKTIVIGVVGRNAQATADKIVKELSAGATTG